MSASSSPELRFAKPAPRVVGKHQRRSTARADLDAAYADVDLRDGGFSWVTGRYTQPGAIDPRVRREHHHLKGRRVMPEWVTKPERIITVTAEEHALITAEMLIVEGTDARKAIYFHWAGWVKAEQKPFRIKGKREDSC